MIINIFFLWACGPTEIEPMLSGSLSPDGHDLSADFYGYQAFGFDNEGTLVVYIASQKEASCESVASYIKGESIDPSQLFEPQSCNLFVKVSDYEGSWQAQDDRMLSASSSINCTMGDGAFEYENGSDSGYYWTGNWWAGFPIEYNWSITGDRETSYALEIEMKTYEGSFPLEEFDRYEARGTVSGSVEAQVCPELGSTGQF